MERKTYKVMDNMIGMKKFINQEEYNGLGYSDSYFYCQVPTGETETSSPFVQTLMDEVNLRAKDTGVVYPDPDDDYEGPITEFPFHNWD